MSEERETAIVALEGEIDLATAPEAERWIADAEAREPGRLVIDLREVTFMDSSGAPVLLTAHQRAEEAGRGFALVRGGDTVNRLLDVTGLTDGSSCSTSRPRRASALSAASSNQTHEGGPERTPQRSARRSTMTRPQPPAPRSSAGTGSALNLALVADLGANPVAAHSTSTPIPASRRRSGGTSW